MKKIVFLIVMVLLSSGLMSMNHSSRHTLSSETTGMYVDGIGYVLPEVHIVAYASPQDTIRNQNREQKRKENHGLTVSETAQDTPYGSGKGEVVSDVAKQKGVQQQDRDRTNYKKQIKSQTHKSTNFGGTMRARPMHQARPLTSPRGGRK